MLRLVVLLIVAAAIGFCVLRLIRAAKTSNIDWTGVASMIAFVAMAFWLRHVTGIG